MSKRTTSAEDFDGVSVHAGFPNPALDTSLESLNLNQLLITHPIGTFFMRIEGSEWESQGIFDQDIIIIDRVYAPKNNDLVIWWQGDSFVISAKQKVPIDTPIWGVVTSVIHQFRKRT